MSSSEPESNSESNLKLNSNSESFVNQITLQYLMNKSQYTNYLEKKTSELVYNVRTWVTDRACKV